MSIKDMIGRAVNGAHSGADSSAETATLLWNYIAGLLLDFARHESVETLDQIAGQYGIGFVAQGGRITGVVME